MQLQAYKGYFQQGNFYSDGEMIPIPERLPVTLVFDNQEIDHGAKFLELLAIAHRQAIENGTSEMTMDEINEIIAEEQRKALPR